MTDAGGIEAALASAPQAEADERSELRRNAERDKAALSAMKKGRAAAPFVLFSQRFSSA